MSIADEKKFVIKQVFTDIPDMNNLEMYYGKNENHFNAPWCISRYKYNDMRLRIYLNCSKFNGTGENWSIETEMEMNLILESGENLSKNNKHTYNNTSTVQNSFFFSSAEWKNHLVDGKLTVEVKVKITKMEGIKTEKLRNFDESAKEVSDIVLKIEDEKFYVCKMYLAAHSSYFKSLLFGNFDESEQSEIELKNENPHDFQNFLEVLYAEPGVDEDTVEGILHLADMYDSKAAIRQCEKFLMENSKQSLQMKFEAAIKYKMDKLRKKCLTEMSTKDDILSVVPVDVNQMEQFVWAELLHKLASFM